MSEFDLTAYRGVPDLAPAVNYALACAAGRGDTGARVILPSGDVHFGSEIAFTYPGAPFSLSLSGEGAGVTTAIWDTTSAIALSMSDPDHTIHMSDMTIAAGTANTNAGISVQNSSPQGAFGQNDFTRLTFRGSDVSLRNCWTTALEIVGLGCVNYDGCLFYGTSNGMTLLGDGVSITGVAGTPNPFSIVHNFSGCSFWNLADCMVYGDLVQGVSVSDSNFTTSTNGIIQPGGSTGGAQLAVSNSQFNCYGNGIIQGGALNNIQVSNSLFLLVVPGSSAFALAGSGSEHTFIGNVVSAMGTPPLSGSQGVNVAAPNSTGTVIGNTFQGLVTGVNLTSATGFTVNSNRYVACSNNVVPGTGNSVGIITP